MTETVLVVEQDPAAREEVGGWLAEEGFEVLQCPGPQAPDYVCIGGRGAACPLAAAADLVVLDLWLGGDVHLRGTPSRQLLAHYRSLGAPVVALSEPGSGVWNLAEEGVEVVTLPADRVELLAAVAKLLGRSAGEPEGPSNP